MPAKKGWKVTVSGLIVRDHRTAVDDPERHYKSGDVITQKDLDDRSKYPGAAPRPFPWVVAGIVEPVGFDTYTVAEPVPADANPAGLADVGRTVTAEHFPRRVNVQSLIDEGLLVPVTDETHPTTEEA